MPAMERGIATEGAAFPRAAGVDGPQMLHCLLAVIFAATFMGVLAGLGLVSHPDSRCQGCGAGADQGYTWCSAWQDVRSFMSFVFGVLVCSLFERMSGSQHPEQSSPRERRANAKGSIHACLLW
mmetsp:Transcript_6778/g.16995  ORF Transcript_6778/g.16995 Transcript_6778/m.16995 type:complete len:124 (-) Transcript_6778:182-553(-)|eukprot:CAMPEP_0183393574 /NCGR_PEP_ID=MMETSP0370-20130417/8022_1 /TAXON_ID=268820 /ORGANISM="Peridinium aciculiferum, Strain PAER-2" /LENGTH=123 /DNA_ID=CAMNT_0025573813 /DNA_START=6 /DNA_END=377 /DNA_ORIENTATION=-